MHLLEKAGPGRHDGNALDVSGVSPALWNDWMWQMENRLQGQAGLARIPGLGTEERRNLGRVIKRYPWSVTPYYLSLVQWDHPEDPIRKQFLPDPMEASDTQRGSPDPLEERAHTVVPGLVQRYPDRVLLLSTTACAVHCRHCLRKRRWLTPPLPEDATRWDRMLSHLRSDRSIRDVLISGGDPLTLPDERLAEILEGLRQIPHVEIIRIGTRTPVVLPQRINSELCRMLEGYGPIWVITQFNHPQEITREAADACTRLLRAGVPVNNQSVLLRGINDDAEIMKQLCRGLLRIRVRPYYLHQCDPVAGAMHFRCPVERGIEIIQEMHRSVSGMAVPKFVIDLPGKGGKIPLQPDYVVSIEKGTIHLRSHAGEAVAYEDPLDPDQA